MTPFNETLFRERLLCAMEQSGLSREEISQKTGIPLSRLERYLKDRLPSGVPLRALCRTLGVRCNYLLDLPEYAKGAPSD